MPSARQWLNDQRPVRTTHPAILLASAILVIVCSGCAGISLSPEPRIHPRALETVNALQAVNSELRSCKGTGWLTTGPARQEKKYRVAFAAAPPTQARITLLAAGYPVETIVATGQKVMFVSHTKDHSPYTFNKPDPCLENAFSIPIRMSDIIRLLSGQIPLPGFKHLYLVSEENGRRVVDLKKDFSPKKYRITARNGRPESIACHDENGELSYTIIFQPAERFGPVSVHPAWRVTSSKGAGFSFRLDDFHSDIPLKDSVFQLTDSE